MHDPLTYSAAFLIGLLGGAHCVGMCGGIMGALAFAVPPEKRVKFHLVPLILSYNVGRIISYGLAGALVGGLSWLATESFQQLGTMLRYAAGVMLILMGLYLAGWWPLLRHLEQAGSKLWQLLQPSIKLLMPVKTPIHALLIGTIWGWIPCGLIYSTLVWAATAADWRESALIMLSFGLGTLPAVLTAGLLMERMKQLMQSKGFRRSAGGMIVLFGVWTLPLHLFSQHTSIHDHQVQPATQKMQSHTH